MKSDSGKGSTKKVYSTSILSVFSTSILSEFTNGLGIFPYFSWGILSKPFSNSTFISDKQPCSQKQ